ncbi:MAG: F0F1 ATP synthase subunit delta [Ruminococcaceae bacterium]|nr:F0F1 ATP synthase subunit delta [Oscillospiraceae bacterium]
MISNFEDYSRALFELASEENVADAVLSDLMTVKDVLAENPGFTGLLDSPAVSTEERIAMVDDAFKGASYITLNFIKLLTEMRQMSAFFKCADGYCKLYDDANGILRAEIITAVELSDAQCDAICAKITAATGKKVIPSKKIDPSILGGVILRYEGRQLDGSIASRLDGIKKQLADIVL